MDVNLLKTRVKSDALNSTQTGFGGTVLDSSIHLKKMGVSQEEGKKVLINLLLMALFTFLAKMYTDTSKSSERKLRKKLQANIVQIEKEIKSKKDLVKEFSKYKVEGDEFKRKIMAVKELSRFRLHELKALDYLQEIIPEKLWFKNVNYEDRIFVLEGAALEQKAFSDFLIEMENSNFFHDIQIRKSIEEKTARGTEVIFEVQARLKVI